jgi:hypothetical protein
MGRRNWDCSKHSHAAMNFFNSTCSGPGKFPRSFSVSRATVAGESARKSLSWAIRIAIFRCCLAMSICPLLNTTATNVSIDMLSLKTDVSVYGLSPIASANS